MQVVTARLTEQVEHLVELAESNQAATDAARRAVADDDRDVELQTAAATVAADDAVAGTLGQLAMLLNNVELRDSVRGRGAGGGRGGGRGQGGQGRRGEGGGAAPAPVHPRHPVRPRRPRSSC